MNADEIVRALREKYDETDVVYFFARTIFREAADLIESLQAQLAESKRRERAAVKDLATYKECGFCVHVQDQQYCYKNCQRHVDADNFRTHPCWEWRGPQEAGEGESHERN